MREPLGKFIIFFQAKCTAFVSVTQATLTLLTTIFRKASLNYTEIYPISVEETAYPVKESQEGSIYPVYEEQQEELYPSDFYDYQTIILLNDLIPPTAANSPQPGTASISGLLYQTQGSMVLKNLDFYLSPAVEAAGMKVVNPIITNPDPAVGDVIGRTNDNGIFFLDNIPPGDYFLLINFPDRSVVAQADQTLGNILLISLSAGDQIPLGVLFIND